jgi:hypothetical protein
MTAAHRKLYQAAKEGNLTAYLQQQEEVERLFIITFIQVGVESTWASYRRAWWL